MTQHQLNRAVARATGETVETIRNRGFIFIACPKPIRFRSGRSRRRSAQTVSKEPKDVSFD
jgi:hypothetical protein